MRKISKCAVLQIFAVTTLAGPAIGPADAVSTTGDPYVNKQTRTRCSNIPMSACG
ncbi:hypothetical protein JOH51_000184 [Rhizobium leguminosarum]|nr:hypothetical protein [Rhizobium leguminosarum]